MTTQEAVETVKEVEGAVGYGPYSRALEAATSVLRIDGKHPMDDGYPSAVTLSLLYKEGALTPDAKSFLKFAQSSTAHRLMTNWVGIPVR
jgi:phosphate transport system substrate-binding protein